MNGAKVMDYALKFTGKDTVAGLAIPFGSASDRDIDGEFFTADVDLCIDWFGKSGRPVLYNHGLDGSMKTTIIGRQIDYEARAEGIWAESQLDVAAKYRKAVDRLISEGALGYSSGAMPHLATKSANGQITRWPWVELSLTPIPAHPGTAIHYVKAATAMWGDATPDPESLSERLVRVSDELAGVATHASEHVEMRVKAGKVLSKANRAQIEAVLEALSAFDPHRDALAKLLADTADPDPEAEKALTAAVFEGWTTLSRLQGVSV